MIFLIQVFAETHQNRVLSPYDGVWVPQWAVDWQRNLYHQSDKSNKIQITLPGKDDSWSVDVVSECIIISVGG